MIFVELYLILSCRSHILKCTCTGSNQTVTRTFTNSRGDLIQRTFYKGKITFDSMMNCPDTRTALEAVLDDDNRMAIRNDKDIAFQMISDNLNDTLRQVGNVYVLISLRIVVRKVEMK